MADYIPLRTAATFRLVAGTNPETGKTIYKTISISAIDPALTAVDYEAAIAKLPDVLDLPLHDSRKTVTSLVE